MLFSDLKGDSELFQKSKIVRFKSVVSSWLGLLGEPREAQIAHDHCEEEWNEPKKGEGTCGGGQPAWPWPHLCRWPWLKSLCSPHHGFLVSKIRTTVKPHFLGSVKVE